MFTEVYILKQCTGKSAINTGNIFIFVHEKNVQSVHT